MRRRFVSCNPVFLALSLTLVVALIISGCAGKIALPPPAPPTENTPRPSVTPPVSEPARPGPSLPGQPPPEPAQPEQTRPESPPTEGEETTAPSEDSPPPLQPKLGPAASLYHRSEQHLKEGRLDQAEMALERALRIEPRNPYYWHAMAKIRLRQGKKSEAIQCCLKSNSLAAASSPLIRRNKALIKRAQAGDTPDAGFE